MKTLFVILSALVVFVYSLGAAVLIIARDRWNAR